MIAEFESPHPETIRQAVESAGGITVVADHLHKSNRAVRYWTTGERNIDFANWMQIRILTNYDY